MLKHLKNCDPLNDVMRRSNCFAPIPPPGHPRGHHFFVGCPGLLTTLFFPCLALYEHLNQSFFQCPALFYRTHFSFDPVAAPGGMGAEQFDRRITVNDVKILVASMRSKKCMLTLQMPWKKEECPPIATKDKYKKRELVIK